MRFFGDYRAVAMGAVACLFVCTAMVNAIGCNPNPCANGGTCGYDPNYPTIDAWCGCPVGYEGATCEIRSNVHCTGGNQYSLKQLVTSQLGSVQPTTPLGNFSTQTNQSTVSIWARYSEVPTAATTIAFGIQGLFSSLNGRLVFEWVTGQSYAMQFRFGILAADPVPLATFPGIGVATMYTIVTNWNGTHTLTSLYINTQLVYQSAVVPPSTTTPPRVQINGYASPAFGGLPGEYDTLVGFATAFNQSYINRLFRYDWAVAPFMRFTFNEPLAPGMAVGTIVSYNSGYGDRFARIQVSQASLTVYRTVCNCSSNPCQNFGNCSTAISSATGQTSFNCSCAAGYVGMSCEFAPCSSMPCANGGTCSVAGIGYACACAVGYSGSQCETNIDDCASVPCKNGGTCNDLVDAYTCTCAAQSFGSDCGIVPCASQPCQHGGTCSSSSTNDNCGGSHYSGFGPLAAARQGSASINGSHIVILAGGAGATIAQQTNTVMYYNVQTASFLAQRDSLSVARNSPCGGATPSLGGLATFAAASSPTAVGANVVDLYNQTDGRWTRLANLTYNRGPAFCGIGSNGKYVIGGGRSAASQDYLEVCDLSINGNCAASFSLVTTRFAPSAGIVIDTKVYYGSWYNADPANYGKIDVYDLVAGGAPTTLAATFGDQNAGALYGHAAPQHNLVVVYTPDGGNLYSQAYNIPQQSVAAPYLIDGVLLGGCLTPGNNDGTMFYAAGVTSGPSTSVLQYNPLADTWSPAVDWKVSRYDGACASADNTALFYGGRNATANRPLINYDTYYSSGTSPACVGQYACSCAAGYAGTQCQTDVNECASSPCENGGTCHDGVVSWSCTCASGYTGARCQTQLPPGPCASTPCAYGSPCNEYQGAFNCTCPATVVTGKTCSNVTNFSGLCDQDCGMQIVPCGFSKIYGYSEFGANLVNIGEPLTLFVTAAVTNSPFANIALITVPYSAYYITMGFVGGNFSGSLTSNSGTTDYNLCVSQVGREYLLFGNYAYYVMTTSGNGDIQLYVNGNQVASCLLPPMDASANFLEFRIATGSSDTPYDTSFGGYFTRLGAANVHMSAFEVASTYFNNQNAPQNTPFKVYVCPNPNFGSTAGRPNLMNQGTISDLTFFYQISSCGEGALYGYDTCKPGPCNATNTVSQVKPPVGGVTCTCATGWAQPYCATEIDYCTSTPCVNGDCHPVFNGYVCECYEGYTGTNCQITIDECTSSPCQNGATCTVTSPGWACTCPRGFTGERCQTNIDECASFPCRNGGSCIDGPDGFECQCTGGYVGTVCTDAPCMGEQCLNGGTCIPFATCRTIQSPVHDLVARYHVTVVQAYNLLLFAGGQNEDAALDAITSVDMTTGEVKNFGVLFQARFYFGGSTNEQTGILVFAGGQDTNGNFFNIVDIYNFNTNVWSTTEMSTIALYSQTFLIHGDFYVITNSPTDNQLAKLSGTTGEFVDARSIASGGEFAIQVGVAIGNSLYVYQGFSGEPSTVLVVYNAVSDTVSFVPGVFADTTFTVTSAARAGDSAVFFAYTRNSQYPTGQTVFYTPSTNTTNTLKRTPYLPTLDNDGAAGSLVGAFYVEMTNQNGPIVYSKVVGYSVETGAFRELTNLTVPRMFVGVGYHDHSGTYAAAGGFNYTNGVRTLLTTIDLYDQYSMQPLTPTCRSYFNCSCTIEYYGRNCSQRIDNPCLSSPCLHSGTCTKLSNTTYACNCTGTGYNGTRCEQQINACATDNGGCGIGRLCYNTPGVRNCSLCIPGYNGTTDCTPCNVGYYTSQMGSLACTPCANGTFQSYTASSTCLNCTAGDYGPEPAATQCFPCQPGKFSAHGASSACYSCFRGKFQSNQGSSACLNCTVGHYNPDTGRTLCPSCLPRTYQPSTGASFCYNCSTHPADAACAISSSSTAGNEDSSTGENTSSSGEHSSSTASNPITPSNSPVIIGAATTGQVIAPPAVLGFSSVAISSCLFFVLAI